VGADGMVKNSAVSIKKISVTMYLIIQKISYGAILGRPVKGIGRLDTQTKRHRQGKTLFTKSSFILFCFVSYVWILAVHTLIYLPSRKSITISNNRIIQVVMRAMLVVLFD
jgi:hypothetical protein